MTEAQVRPGPTCRAIWPGEFLGIPILDVLDTYEPDENSENIED